MFSQGVTWLPEGLVIRVYSLDEKAEAAVFLSFCAFQQAL